MALVDFRRLGKREEVVCQHHVDTEQIVLGADRPGFDRGFSSRPKNGEMGRVDGQSLLSVFEHDKQGFTKGQRILRVELFLDPAWTGALNGVQSSTLAFHCHGHGILQECF